MPIFRVFLPTTSINGFSEIFHYQHLSQLMRLWSYRIGEQRRLSGETAHLRSLARAFAVRTHKVWK